MSRFNSALGMPRGSMAGLVGIIFLLVVNLAVSESNIRRLVQDEQRVIDVHADLTAFEELLADVREAESAERGFLITGDAEFLKPYESAAARAVAALGRLELRAAQDPQELAQLAPLRRVVDARLTEFREAIDARNDGGFEVAQRIVATNQGRRLMASIRTPVADFRRDEDVILAGRAADLRRSVYMAIVTDVIAAVISIALVGLAFVLIRRDFLRQRRADEIARRLAAIVASSDDAIIGEAIDGVITSWNAGATEIFGFTAGEMVGQSTQKLVPPSLAAEGRGRSAFTTRGIQFDHYETKRLTRDGRIIDVSLNVSPIKDCTGNVIGIASIGRDITEQKALQKAVLDIASQEQRRIGQDLHDGAGQELTGLAMLSRKLVTVLEDNSAPAAKIAERIAEGIEAVLQSVRTLSRGLVPVQLDRQGLMSALADLAARTSELHDTICTFHCDEPVCIPNNDVATNLYRMSQEAVTNAIKHGSAKNIVISLLVDGNRVALKVTDDGSGVKPLHEAAGAGMGLRIMQYRARLIGAELEVTPGAPCGTEITCSFNCIRMPDGSCEPASYIAGEASPPERPLLDSLRTRPSARSRDSHGAAAIHPTTAAIAKSTTANHRDG